MKNTPSKPASISLSPECPRALLPGITYIATWVSLGLTLKAPSVPSRAAFKVLMQIHPIVTASERCPSQLSLELNPDASTLLTSVTSAFQWSSIRSRGTFTMKKRISNHPVCSATPWSLASSFRTFVVYWRAIARQNLEVLSKRT